jgi:GNAT superfamily N-acetyltransferase
MDTSEISYSNDQISVAEFKTLLEDAGWPLPDDTAIIDSLNNTSFSVAARDINGDLMGYGRIIGDSSLHHYISDVVVLRRFRRHGIGSKIMSHLMGHIQGSAKPGAFVGLFSTRGHELFFARHGFIQRPNAQNGAGMFLAVSGE